MSRGKKTGVEKRLARITGWQHRRCVDFLRERGTLEEQCAEILVRCGPVAADAWRAERTRPA